jgi:probable F420-dependent oxidoreductase
MKVDAGVPTDLAAVATVARRATEAGFNGLWSSETNHDPFLPLTLAAERAPGLDLGTAIAVAFARTPMTVATVAHDLQRFSGGRFHLGLGSQIRAHIEKRFGMPWSRPAARMREFVLALRAIWDCWDNGSSLKFRGDFYSHTLMTSFFSPEPSTFAPPKILIAAIGDNMTRVAGEVADGLLVHSFTTERYLREVTIPALRSGFAAAGRSRSDFQVAYPGFVVTGSDEEAMQASAREIRRRIAFYGSTPAYRPVLELHGWGDLQTELHTLSLQGRWADMGGLIDDEVLETFAVVAEPEKVAQAILARFGGLVDRFMLTVPRRDDLEAWAPVSESLNAETPADHGGEFAAG